MNKKAFIFTMDATLALIPIFIVMASVSQISGGLSLYQQAHVLGGERISQDVLEALVITDMLSNESLPGVNDSLEALVPQHLNYSFDLNFNESTIYNFTRGNSSKAKDVMVAKRAVSMFMEEIVGMIEEVTRFGTGTAQPCSSGAAPGKPRIYNMSFNVSAGDKTKYDFWLVIEKTEIGQPSWVETCPNTFCGFSSCDDVNPPTQIPPQPLFQRFKYDIDEDNNLTEGVENWVYIETSGQVGIDSNFYVIKAPAGTDSEQISPEAASRKQHGIATLKVWGEENE